MARDTYGNEVTQDVLDFHRSRVMIAIVDGELKLKENSEESHVDWFIHEGWINDAFDPKFDNITRGYFNLTGVYLYKGYNFRRDDGLDHQITSMILPMLRHTIKVDLPVYSGLIVGESVYNPDKYICHLFE